MNILNKYKYPHILACRFLDGNACIKSWWVDYPNGYLGLFEGYLFEIKYNAEQSDYTIYRLGIADEYIKLYCYNNQLYIYDTNSNNAVSLSITVPVNTSVVLYIRYVNNMLITYIYDVINKSLTQSNISYTPIILPIYSDVYFFENFIGYVEYIRCWNLQDLSLNDIISLHDTIIDHKKSYVSYLVAQNYMSGRAIINTMLCEQNDNKYHEEWYTYPNIFDSRKILYSQNYYQLGINGDFESVSFFSLPLSALRYEGYNVYGYNTDPVIWRSLILYPINGHYDIHGKSYISYDNKIYITNNNILPDNVYITNIHVWGTGKPFSETNPYKGYLRSCVICYDNNPIYAYDYKWCYPPSGHGLDYGYSFVWDGHYDKFGYPSGTPNNGYSSNSNDIIINQYFKNPNIRYVVDAHPWLYMKYGDGVMFGAAGDNIITGYNTKFTKLDTNYYIIVGYHYYEIEDILDDEHIKIKGVLLSNIDNDPCIYIDGDVYKNPEYIYDYITIDGHYYYSGGLYSDYWSWYDIDYDIYIPPTFKQMEDDMILAKKNNPQGFTIIFPLYSKLSPLDRYTGASISALNMAYQDVDNGDIYTTVTTNSVYEINNSGIYAIKLTQAETNHHIVRLWYDTNDNYYGEIPTVKFHDDDLFLDYQLTDNQIGTGNYALSLIDDIYTYALDMYNNGVYVKHTTGSISSGWKIIDQYNDPVVGAYVWFKGNTNPQSPIAGSSHLTTDSNGDCVCWSDIAYGSNVYVYAYRAGYTFDNPTIMELSTHNIIRMRKIEYVNMKSLKHMVDLLRLRLGDSSKGMYREVINSCGVLDTTQDELSTYIIAAYKHILHRIKSNIITYDYVTIAGVSDYYIGNIYEPIGVYINDVEISQLQLSGINIIDNYSANASGMPSNYVYAANRIILHPIPDNAYRLSIIGYGDIDWIVNQYEILSLLPAGAEMALLDYAEMLARQARPLHEHNVALAQSAYQRFEQNIEKYINTIRGGGRA